ncbi:Endonuclease/Exonuclease/phosphatase family protein [Tritrichomonas foetus]|uniref:Endonuclease/Exonuclease/phosphatase family protein n=1 Tax=Tritrichomonas foetus TaxID=1144522 RepID=A0A1J4JVW6_9EUKA|nr:Endonuclease/Exonuclease/phosphatase family protein [Tritrichomonas foetus]|eukprot:OHT01676.1 Endonuclease/Exonuclease/phosphatase family protein [Tritrichomonas foetus]
MNVYLVECDPPFKYRNILLFFWMILVPMLLLTWNIGNPFPFANLSSTFSLIKKKSYDIMAFSFQEIDKRSNIYDDKCIKSMKILTNTLQKEFQNYTIVSSSNLQSTALFILLNKNISYSVSEKQIKLINHDACAKASILINLEINSKRVTFIGNHFEFDMDNYEERNKEWLNVVKNCDNNSDYDIMMGDLNYRVEMSRNKAIRRIEQKNYARLLKSDQLLMAKKNYPILAAFEESPITFPPTYKFDVKSDQYDTSPKQRVPSYTDRILVATRGNNSKPEVTKYDFIQSHVSDHRPVYAEYIFSL